MPRSMARGRRIGRALTWSATKRESQLRGRGEARQRYARLGWQGVAGHGLGGYAEPRVMTSVASLLPWLLDADPSLRWQVLGDLSDASPSEVLAERARVAREGFGAQLLARQAPDGTWGGAAWNRGWDSTLHVLSLLRELGLDPASAAAERALGRVRDQVTWAGCGPRAIWGHGFFAGETEPCINAQVVAVGAYFGQDVQGLIERLLSEQLADGGWNCEAPHRSTRASFNTTIGVLEALLAYERSTRATIDVSAARQRGQEYLLERRLSRRQSTGTLIARDRKGGASWSEFAMPTWWHYDLLRALEYFRQVHTAPDPRVAEAIALVAAKQTQAGWWLMDTRHSGTMPIELDGAPGEPSRWLTLRALRVLRWAGVADRNVVSMEPAAS